MTVSYTVTSADKNIQSKKRYGTFVPTVDAVWKKVIQMKVVIDIPKDRYADIQRIASVQLERRWPTPEQIIAKGVTINEPQKWIPVSERLPKRDEVVLVTYKTTGKIHLCKYLDDTSENAWWSYIDDCYAWNNVVLAWMPLPPAYKGEEK